MIRKILDNFKNLDKLTSKIMNYGLKFCFAVCVLSSPFIYYIGINLFKIGLIFAIEFIICGFVVDGIKKQLI